MALTVDLSTIPAGFSFPPETIALDAATVGAYLAAVEDGTSLYAGSDAPVPPMALVALALRSLAELIAASPGTLHLSQTATACHAVPIGATVTAHVSVQSRSVRRGFAALYLAIRIEDAQGIALEGVSFLMVPLRAEDADDA